MVFTQLLFTAQFHGCKRLSGRYKYCWALCLLPMLWAAVSIVWITVFRFFDHPTFMSITESSKIFRKFPGVLICPEILFPEYKMDELVSKINFPPNMNASEFRSKLRQLAAFYAPDVKYQLNDLKMLEYVLQYNLLDIATAGEQLTASCEETILRCRYLEEIRNCSSMFKMELTSYGFCCVFNARSLKREIQEFGLHKAKKPPAAYVAGGGHTKSLILVVNSSLTLTDIDLSYKWAGLMKGMTHVEVGVNGTPLSPNTEHWLGFHAVNIISSEETRHLSPDLRGCELPSKRLSYFPFYSKTYCRVECEMARTMERCRCVPITHPRPPNAPICTAKSLSCVKNAAVTYDTDQCDCPPTCDIDLYYTITASFPLTPGSYSYDHFYDGLNFEHVAIIRAYLYHQEKRRFTRNSFFKSWDLFAQLGGVFNVFFGCSILTIFELVQIAMYGIRERRGFNTEKRKEKLVSLPVTKKHGKRIRDKKKVVMRRK